MVMGEVENTVIFPASRVQLSVESDGRILICCA